MQQPYGPYMQPYGPPHAQPYGPPQSYRGPPQSYGGPPQSYGGPPRAQPSGGQPGKGRPLGVRGPPSGRPQVDLAQADTGTVDHVLYVKIVNGGDRDEKSQKLTLSILQYVNDIKAVLGQMGITVKVESIKSTSLQSPALVAAMKKRGITRLPALRTKTDVYLGDQEIRTVYDRNIREYEAVGRRDERPTQEDVPDDDLVAYYMDEMTFDRAEEDTEELGLGESENMMDAYRDMMDRREKSRAHVRPPQPGRTHGPREGPARRPTAAPRARPDNVRAPAVRRPVDPEEAEIQETIDRLSRDIDQGFRDRVFNPGDGNVIDDDGDENIKDDLMEAAYWGNQTES